MLAFQKRIQDHGNKNNLQTIFGVGSIPKSTQLRDVIDLIPSSSFDPIFSDFFSLLQRAKLLEKFQIFNNQYLISIDGTQYFTSENISCPGCLKKTSQKPGKPLIPISFLAPPLFIRTNDKSFLWLRSRFRIQMAAPNRIVSAMPVSA
ncbi:MAG: hypothetical protein KGY42_01335 [Desulfobacterales bacterium]|nr:hypothetical protein [Desulfobacterales bacterium]